VNLYATAGGPPNPPSVTRSSVLMVMIAAEQPGMGSKLRQEALARATDAFERELVGGGIHLDPQTQLALLELVERIEALASDSRVVLVTLPPPDEPLENGWPAEDFDNHLRQNVA
jgi:hypothetical protein